MVILASNVCVGRKAGSNKCKLVCKEWPFSLLVFLCFSSSLQLLQTILEGKSHNMNFHNFVRVARGVQNSVLPVVSGFPQQDGHTLYWWTLPASL